jgi:hypothetical protein
MRAALSGINAYPARLKSGQPLSSEETTGLLENINGARDRVGWIDRGRL